MYILFTQLATMKRLPTFLKIHCLQQLGHFWTMLDYQTTKVSSDIVQKNILYRMPQFFFSSYKTTNIISGQHLCSPKGEYYRKNSFILYLVSLSSITQCTLLRYTHTFVKFYCTLLKSQKNALSRGVYSRISAVIFDLLTMLLRHPLL